MGREGKWEGRVSGRGRVSGKGVCKWEGRVSGKGG